MADPNDLRFYFVPFAPDLQNTPEFRKANIHTIPWKLQYPYLAWFDLSKALEPQIGYYWELLTREQGFATEHLDDLLGRKKKKKTKWRHADIDAILATIHPPPNGKVIEQPVRVPAIKASNPARK